MPVADEPGLRPTAERVRETVFNWLQPVIEGAHCLDLFAGSGALGLEALSRGAAAVVLVEKSARVAMALEKSIALLDARDAKLCVTDTMSWLRDEKPRRFDVVFVDPPFASGGYEELCRLLEERGWLAEGARIYIEQDSDQPPPAVPVDWRLLREKTTGNVRYSLFQAANSGGSR